MFRYYTSGVCSSEITFDIENGLIRNLCFTQGCPGNLQALSKLAEGMPAAEAIVKLRGIICRNGTSCADQLAAALEEALGQAVNL